MSQFLQQAKSTQNKNTLLENSYSSTFEIPKTLLVILAIVTKLANANFVYTQFPQMMTFTTSTPQVRLQTNFGSFNSTQQFTLWGWFKFTGEATAISNIVTLRNTRPLEPGQTAEPFPNPKFPPCPFPLDKVPKDQSIDNPNCFPEKLAAGGKKTVGVREGDLAFVNFDLNNNAPGGPAYSILFLNQIGQGSRGTSDMKIEGFVDIKLAKGAWSFFAVSCDYRDGEASIFYQSFDGSSQPNIKTYRITFPEFQLSKNAELVIASVENNAYFQSTSGFIGDIGLLEMAVFYTTRLDLLWMGFMAQGAYQQNGVELEFLFDSDSGDSLATNAKLSDKYPITGAHRNLGANNPSLVGEVFGQDSSVELKKPALKVDEFTKSLNFYLQFEFEEPLSEEFFVLQKGVVGLPGFFAISLVKREVGSRELRIRARDSAGEVVWNSPIFYEQKKRYKIIIGAANSPAGQLRAVFWDSRGTFDFSEIKKKFKFDVKGDNGKPFSLLNNQSSDSALTGSFTFYRFIILDSASAALYPFLQKDSFVSGFKQQGDKCKIRNSFYEQSIGCLVCDGQIAGPDRSCTNFCPKGFRNGRTDVCVPCRDSACEDAEPNFWLIERLSSDHFQLRPSTPLLGKSTDLSKLVSVKQLDGSSQGIGYSLVPNIPLQLVDIYLTFNESLVNKRLLVEVNPSSENPLFDELRNLVKPGKAEIFIERACYVEPGLKRSMNALAITALALFAASFLFLAIFSLFFRSKILDLASLWKFLFHNWMKFQFVGLLYLLGIYMPCCAKQFLSIIYELMISWDHAMAGPINNSQRSSAVFSEGLAKRQPPVQFLEQGVFAFLLHNMCVAFIVHGVILLTYLIVKIWDWLITSRAYAMYFFFIVMEFSVLIVGYGLFNLQAFTFSALNFRLAIFTHGYFVICFLIAIAYLLVFAVFWAYAGVRLLGSSFYFENPTNHARFYYFFVGYRETKWARTYDLWLWLTFLVDGLMFGLLWREARAQLGVIVGTKAVLFVLSAVLRPWTYLVQFVVELLTQLLLIAAALILLIIAVYDSSGCFDCGHREGSLCLALVALLFVYLSLLSLGLLAQTIFLTFFKEKALVWGAQAKSGEGAFDAFEEKQAIAEQPVFEENAEYYRSMAAQSFTGYSHIPRDPTHWPSLYNDIYNGTEAAEEWEERNRRESDKVGRFGEAGEFSLRPADPDLGQQYSRFLAARGSNKTMLEFMNDVRRQRETDELETFVENGGKSEVRIVPGFKGSLVNETNFFRPSDFQPNSMITDRADEESMQARVLGTLDESRMITLHDYRQKLEQNKMNFQKQKDAFYEEKSTKSDNIGVLQGRQTGFKANAIDLYGSPSRGMRQGDRIGEGKEINDRNEKEKSRFRHQF